MKLQQGNTYQHADIGQQMEWLKQRHIIAVLKFRSKLYVGIINQQGQEELLVYCFDDNQEMLKFNEFVRERYNHYKSEVKQC